MYVVFGLRFLHSFIVIVCMRFHCFFPIDSQLFALCLVMMFEEKMAEKGNSSNINYKWCHSNANNVWKAVNCWNLQTDRWCSNPTAISIGARWICVITVIYNELNRLTWAIQLYFSADKTQMGTILKVLQLLICNFSINTIGISHAEMQSNVIYPSIRNRYYFTKRTHIQCFF